MFLHKKKCNPSLKLSTYYSLFEGQSPTRIIVLRQGVPYSNFSVFVEKSSLLLLLLLLSPIRGGGGGGTLQRNSHPISPNPRASHPDLLSTNHNARSANHIYRPTNQNTTNSRPANHGSSSTYRPPPPSRRLRARCSLHSVF